LSITRTTVRLRSDGRPVGIAGRVGATVFFLIWLTIPTVMIGFMVGEATREVAPWSWREADCTILESGVSADKSDNFTFTVRYQYAAGTASAVEAPPRVGTVYARGHGSSTDYSDAQRLVLRYPAGARATCWVNPDNPDEAVLKRTWPLVGLMVPFPLLFIAIGLGGLWFTWRTAKPKEGPVGPITGSGRTVRLGARAVAAFFGLFLVIGLVVLAVMGANVRKVFASGSWTPVQATVVSSGVRSHHSDDSTTYSVNILYRYTVDGRELRSNRYGFMGGSSSGYDSKREVVRRYAPGTTFTAYVNPADPADAVIERGFTSDMWVLLVPAVFIAVGGAGLYFALKFARRANLPGGPPRLAAPPAGRYAPVQRSAPQAGRPTGGPITLAPHQSPLVKLIAFTIICVFWNGIVSVFLYQAVTGWASGRGEVCLSVFLIPFVAVGVGLIVGVAHTLLALFNPRCTLTLDRQPALGETLEVRWTFTGRFDRVHRLVLRVEGREEATYRRGTSTYTDKNVFHAGELVDTSRAMDVRAGKTRLTVPADTMHTFSAANNKVVWVLILHGHIQGWPDVKDEYALNVLPLAIGNFAVPNDEGPSRLAEPDEEVEESEEESTPQPGRLNDGVDGGSRWT
jgi:hypothetical protein